MLQFLIFFFSPPDFEASFIRLLDKVTNGTRIEINQTGEFHNADTYLY